MVVTCSVLASPAPNCRRHVTDYAHATDGAISSRFSTGEAARLAELLGRLLR
ncbi:MAG: hypothetical protein WBC68_01040 [Albidovulum sp.]